MTRFIVCISLNISVSTWTFLKWPVCKSIIICYACACHSRKTSEVFGILRTSSGIFRNDRVVFKNPSIPRIKISRLYLRKSWQVYDHQVSLHFNCVKDLLYSVFVYNFTPTIISASCCLLEKQQRTTLHTTHIQNWTTRIYYVT